MYNYIKIRGYLVIRVFNYKSEGRFDYLILRQANDTIYDSYIGPEFATIGTYKEKIKVFSSQDEALIIARLIAPRWPNTTFEVIPAMYKVTRTYTNGVYNEILGEVLLPGEGKECYGIHNPNI